MLLTVSGPPGSGKSTTAARLAEAFDLDHVSGGDIFRDLAADRGMSPLEFNKLAESDESIDRDLDRRLYEIARNESDLVLESRLAGWLSGDAADFRFWLEAPASVRGERIAEREDIDPARATEETTQREASEATRYQEYYGIRIDDLSIYDMIVNTARWDPDAVVQLIVSAIDAFDADHDEGQATVPPVPLDR